MGNLVNFSAQYCGSCDKIKQAICYQTARSQVYMVNMAFRTDFIRLQAFVLVERHLHCLSPTYNLAVVGLPLAVLQAG